MKTSTLVFELRESARRNNPAETDYRNNLAFVAADALAAVDSLMDAMTAFANEPAEDSEEIDNCCEKAVQAMARVYTDKLRIALDTDAADEMDAANKRRIAASDAILARARAVQ